MQGAPVPLSCTHSCCSSIRLLRLAGSEPLNSLPLSDLRMQAGPQLAITNSSLSCTHIYFICTRLLRLAGMEPLRWFASRLLRMRDAPPSVPQPLISLLRTHR